MHDDVGTRPARREWPRWLVAGQLAWLCLLDIPLLIATVQPVVVDFSHASTPFGTPWVLRVVAVAAVCWGFVLGRRRRWRHLELLPVVGFALLAVGQTVTIAVESHAPGDGVGFDTVVALGINLLVWFSVAVLMWLGATLGLLRPAG
jgi:hypothetical protein